MASKMRYRFLEWALNLVSIACVLFVATSLVRRQLDRTGPKTASAEVLRQGQTIPIDGVNWQRSRHTLVFALSTSCQFCSESGPFYRALIERRVPTEWQAVAVLPQPTTAAKAYMDQQGYSIPEIRQIGLDQIGVYATPTLLLADQQGRLQQQWIGGLSPAEEEDVAGRLGIDGWRSRAGRASERHSQANGPGASSPLVATDELLAMLRRNQRINLVDVREREQYREGHVLAAVNIPADELDVRAPHEFRLGAPTIIYCNFSTACANRGMASLCSDATERLTRVGVANVRAIRDPLALLAEAGVPITTPSPPTGDGGRMVRTGS